MRPAISGIGVAPEMANPNPNPNPVQRAVPGVRAAGSQPLLDDVAAE